MSSSFYQNVCICNKVITFFFPMEKGRNSEVVTGLNFSSDGFFLSKPGPAIVSFPVFTLPLSSQAGKLLWLVCALI